MPLPKGLLAGAASTVAGPDKAASTDVATPPIVATPATINIRKDLRQRYAVEKKRVHYTLDADLIAWAEDAYHDHRRADGSRCRSASEYVAELLRLARNRSRS